MRNLVSCFARALLLGQVLFHAVGAQGAAQVARPTSSGIGEINGTLIDSASARPIPSGSITVRRDTVFAGGALPKADGTFQVDGLPPGTYNLRIRALGYAQFIKTGIVISADKPVIALGKLMLHTVATKLAGQEVVAEREQTVIQPDRTSYSAKNMVAASGGTAIDVLRNIPQVEVDGSNKVSLRGNGNVVIQINGRSTPLKGEQLGTFLSQMPANVVKTIEVAANPSAKDDPEGTAGIINIVLNQEAEIGLSGGIGGGTSTTGQLSSYGNVGKQQGKVTAFLSVNLYKDRRQTSGTISRENLILPVPKFVETSLSGRQRPLSGGGNMRSEYKISETDAITFDSYLFGGEYTGSNQSSYADFDITRDQIGAFNQANESRSRNLSQDYDIAFRRQGKPTIPQFTVELEYANNTNTNDINLSGRVIQVDASTPAFIQTEHDHTIGKYPYFNAKVDYSYPFDPKTKLETGAKYQDRSTTSEFTAAYLDTTSGAFNGNPSRSTSFTYREHIEGGYGLFSRAIGKFQTQAGVRLESAHTQFDLPISNQHFTRQYNSAYPSGIVTYNLSDMRSVRTSYSRRVSRPNPYQLSPIEFRQDTRNVFRGNPTLGAEYTDALDFSFQEAHTWGSLQVNPYIRRTNNAVKNIQYVDTNGVSVSTFENLSHNALVGTSLNANYRHGPLTSGLGVSSSYYTSDASNLTVTSSNLSTKAFMWSLNGNGTWKFSNTVDAQGFGFYRPATKTEGGSSIASVNMSFGARYKIWGDQGNISVRVNDPFNMQKFGYRTANGQVIEYSERFFGARAVFLTVSRNFGQALRLRPKSDSEGNPAGPATP